MKKNNLILGVLLAITAILFSSFGVSSSSGSFSTEKVEVDIGKSQSNGKTQIDNIFFELVLKDMGKDKIIDFLIA
jgi:hypothetical protein